MTFMFFDSIKTASTGRGGRRGPTSGYKPRLGQFDQAFVSFLSDQGITFIAGNQSTAQRTTLRQRCTRIALRKAMQNDSALPAY